MAWRKPPVPERTKRARRIQATQRRVQVLQLQQQGKTYKQIAEELGLCEATIGRMIRESKDRVLSMSESGRVKAELAKRPAPDDSPQGKALALRIAGWTFKAIAAELQEADETVRRWVNTEMQRLDELEIALVDVTRRMQLERVRELLSAVWPEAMKGDNRAVDTVLKLLERESKLLGIDAPKKVDVEHRIREIAQELGLDPEEAAQEMSATVRRHLRLVK